MLLLQCVAFCDGGNFVLSGGEAWCDYARAATDVCTVVPDLNYDCTGIVSILLLACSMTVEFCSHSIHTYE